MSLLVVRVIVGCIVIGCIVVGCIIIGCIVVGCIVIVFFIWVIVIVEVWMFYFWWKLILGVRSLFVIVFYGIFFGNFVDVEIGFDWNFYLVIVWVFIVFLVLYDYLVVVCFDVVDCVWVELYGDVLLILIVF